MGSLSIFAMIYNYLKVATGELGELWLGGSLAFEVLALDRIGLPGT